MSDIEDSKERSRDRGRRDRSSRFSESSRDRSPDRGGRERSSSHRASNCRVYVSNIPYEYRWQDMKDLFRSQVGDVQFVELFVDDNDKSKGCGIVEFSDQSSVKKCMEVMQRYEVKTRKLIIKEDAGNVRDKHGNIINSKSGRGGRDDRDRYREDRYESHTSSHSSRRDTNDVEGKWGNTYGLSPHFLESLRIDTPLCNRVFVANLEYNVDKKKLKEVFRLAGRLVHVELHHDKDGRSRGFAVVEYDHPVEAVQAISMFHNQVLNDRPMTVRMDRVNETLKLPDGLKGIGMGLGPSGEPLKDVARNLPSLTGAGAQSSAGAGAGLLGAVPNQALQLSALTGLNNVAPFGGLSAANSQVLQAANLAGVSGLTTNLLGNGLSSAELSLVSNQLVPSQAAAQFSALQSQNAANNLQSLNSGSNQGYGRDQSFASGQVAGAFNQTSGYNTVQNKGASSGSFSPFGGGGGRDSGYGNAASVTASALLRSASNALGQKDAPYGRKVLVSNLPASASYKMLNEKFNEFGDVQHLEERGSGSMLIVYGSEWQAERAIKNLDRARIDGRTIEARFYY